MNNVSFKHYNQWLDLPLLSLQEEKELGYLAREHRDQTARFKLITHNTRLVLSIAKKYRHLGANFHDLIHEGFLGLIEAVDRYDERIGRLATFAVWWIKQKIIRFIRNQWRIIRLPMHIFDDIMKLEKANDELGQILERPPSLQELATHLDWELARVKKTVLKKTITSSVSLNQELSPDHCHELADLIPDRQTVDPFVLAAAREVFNHLEKQVGQIIRYVGLKLGCAKNAKTSRNQKIFIFHYGLNDGYLKHTGQETSRASFLAGDHLSRERVNQILEKIWENIGYRFGISEEDFLFMLKQLKDTEAYAGRPLKIYPIHTP